MRPIKTIPIPPEIMTLPVTALGTVGDDWLCTSPDKVEAVQDAGDGEYIYFEKPYEPEVAIHAIIKFNLNLGGITISTPAYEAQVIPQVVEFYSDNVPGGTGWTMEECQYCELECADNTFLEIQSFKADDGLPTCDVISVGIRATIAFEVVGAVIQRRVLKLEKLLKYEVA